MFDFLPTSRTDLEKRGIQQLDIILVSGDAYIDHPSFGTALIGRHLEAHAFSVGIIAQPDWKSDKDFLKLGKPRLFFGVSAGNLDSMVANYTSDKKVRRTDMYSQNNEPGHRPDRACIVYTNKVKQLFPDSLVVLGGVEASLRRFAHYDYWDDMVRRSILFDAKADLLLYGMAEKAIVELAKLLTSNLRLQTAKQIPSSNFQIPNTAVVLKDVLHLKDYIMLPSFEEALADKNKFVEAFKLYDTESQKKNPKIIIQPCQGRYLVVYPPKTMTSEELDSIFRLPFARAPHPSYSATPIPAWDFVKFSTISHRGCFGGCSFCAIGQHQGKYIVSRSQQSIEDEVKNIIMKQKDFKGNILDIGGPSANMYQMKCNKEGGCTRVSCIFPAKCPNLIVSHKPLLKMLRAVRNIPGIRHVFSNSGVRYDLALDDPEYIEELAKFHVSGQLSVAPEHLCEEVLLLMKKPKIGVFEKFKNEFNKYSEAAGKEQYLIPYFISSHPGSTLEHALKLSLFLKKNHMKIEQVQNFLPTPMTASTCMYYTGIDPFSGKAVHVPKGEERSFQRALLQPSLTKNYRQVVKALKQLKRADLINYLTQN